MSSFSRSIAHVPDRAWLINLEDPAYTEWAQLDEHRVPQGAYVIYNHQMEEQPFSWDRIAPIWSWWEPEASELMHRIDALAAFGLVEEIEQLLHDRQKELPHESQRAF